jgi:L-arabinokinase
VSQATAVLAVSGHGYGHAVRCAEVASALLRRGARVVVRSDAPSWLFPADVDWIPSPGWPLDIGSAQRGSLELDVDQTRRQWHAFAAEFDARAEAEADLLRQAGADIVVADIPPLAFAAAARACVPALGMTNFTWDWIYAAWPDFESIVARIRAAYAQAHGLLRLPLHGPCDAFARIEDVPMVARRARRSRVEVRLQLGLPTTAPVVLLSFGGFAAAGLDLATLGRWREYLFLVTPPSAPDAEGLPANVRILNETLLDYVSVLAACDVVVTKPGYGIVSDCLANRVAVLFTERGPFREYEVLAEALPRLGRARHVPRDQLVAGEIGAHLDALLASKAAWTDQAFNGADRVAERVLDRVTIEQNLG